MKIKKTKFKLSQNQLKKWNFKLLEGFLLLDSYFFNEYGLYDTNNIISEFRKKNKKKSKTLFEELKAGDITLNFTGLISVTSWLGYTPDKISHITIGFREKVILYKIYTEDDSHISVTEKQPLLTERGYKQAKDIKTNDCLIGILGNAKKFKKSKNNKYENISDIIKEISQYFGKDKKLNYKKLPQEYKKYLNILGVDTTKTLKKDDFISIIENEKKKDIGLSNLDEAINDKNNLFKRKIKKIDKIEMKNVYIGNITTHLSSNININNFILEQWT